MSGSEGPYRGGGEIVMPWGGNVGLTHGEAELANAAYAAGRASVGDAGLREAAQLAKKALLSGDQHVIGDTTCYSLDGNMVYHALEALRAALSTPQPPAPAVVDEAAVEGSRDQLAGQVGALRATIEEYFTERECTCEDNDGSGCVYHMDFHAVQRAFRPVMERTAATVTAYESRLLAKGRASAAAEVRQMAESFIRQGKDRAVSADGSGKGLATEAHVTGLLAGGTALMKMAEKLEAAALDPHRATGGAT